MPPPSRRGRSLRKRAAVAAPPSLSSSTSSPPFFEESPVFEASPVLVPAPDVASSSQLSSSSLSSHGSRRRGRGGGRRIPGTVLYPEGCKEVSDDMPVDELVRRLKTLAGTLQSWKQEEDVSDEYIPLSQHLAGEGFLRHSSPDVTCLIACCVADILRIYAPQAPYKDPDEITTILNFLISQLQGLKDPTAPGFKRYFYLMENLTLVRTIHMCFDLDDSQDIICRLVHLLFSVIGNNHSARIKSAMLDLLCPVCTECEVISSGLLELILENIVEPRKTSKPAVYFLAKEIIIKCSNELQLCIQQYLNQILTSGNVRETSRMHEKVYDLIYELNQLCPSTLLCVLPQLEYKLTCTDDSERLRCVSLLARMFSEKESKLAESHNPLWQAFLGRFNDVSAAVRMKCVQYSMHFLLNHEHLRRDVVGVLGPRKNDRDENIRLEVVKAVVETAKRDFSIVSENEDLMTCARERMMDKKFKIRREALVGLAYIYRKHLQMETEAHGPPENAQSWIKEKILHGYYMNEVEDRALIEKLLHTCLIPYQLKARERMRTLLHLYCSVDERASKSFVELQKNMQQVRRQVCGLLNLIRSQGISADDKAKQLKIRISNIIKLLPQPAKSAEFILKFCRHLTKDNEMLQSMEAVVSPTTDCKTCETNINLVLKKLGSPVKTNLYHSTVKVLLERASSVLIDKEAAIELMSIVKEVIDDTSDFPDRYQIARDVVLEKAFKLIAVLAFTLTSHFDNETVLEMMIALLVNDSNSLGDENLSRILEALTYIGKGNPISQQHPKLMRTLVSHLEEMVATSTPRQGKKAIRCLFVNIADDKARNDTFAHAVEVLRSHLDFQTSGYLTAVVAIGHIALLMPTQFKSVLKSIISHKIVKELLMNPSRTPADQMKNSGDWCDEDELPEITRCMLAGMKTLVRWLIGTKTDINSAKKLFKMFTAFMDDGGEFIESQVPFNDAEKSWLRLAAGSCMLKICEHKGIGDQFTPVQFIALGNLMIDEVVEVRSRFAKKLHKGLSKGVPHNCLPLDFMGFYALAGYETDKKLRHAIKMDMIVDVTSRRDYVKALLQNVPEKAAAHLSHIMPDYMLVFAVAILTHCPKFTSHTNVKQLVGVKTCLWFIMEPLILRNEHFSFGFYNTLLERLKIHKNGIEPDSVEMNFKMYALCDLALSLIAQRTTSTTFGGSDYPCEPRIPSMYFTRHEDPRYVNLKSYLPPEMQTQAKVEPKKTSAPALTLKQTVPKESTVNAPAAPQSSSSQANASSAKRTMMRKSTGGKKPKRRTPTVDPGEEGNVSIDALPMDAKQARLEIPEEEDD